VKRAVRALAILAAVAAVCLLAGYWPHVRDEWFVLNGNRNESGGWYGWWSGVGGSVPDLAIITGALAWYLHHTCGDHPSCLRWGKYPAAGGLFRLCHVHHPDLQGQRPRRELIHRLHREHQGRQP
jgi:hypothetical protein